MTSAISSATVDPNVFGKHYGMVSDGVTLSQQLPAVSDRIELLLFFKMNIYKMFYSTNYCRHPLLVPIMHTGESDPVKCYCETS